MYSYWLKDSKKKKYPTLKSNIDTDILIIGGGINGISIAYELSKYDYNIALVEQNELYHATTGYTTGKVTFQHGYIYQHLIKSKGKDNAKLYYQGNLLAISHIQEIIKEHNIECDYQICSHSLYSKEKSKEFLNEVKAYETLNIPYIINKSKDYYFLTVEDQAVFHVVKYLDGLLDVLDNRKNVSIFENTRIIKTEVDQKEKISFSDNDVEIRSKIIIFACSYPVYKDFNFYFLKLKPTISFVGEGKVKKELNEAFITEDSPVFSIRPLSGNKVLFAGFSLDSAKLNTYEDAKKLQSEALKKWCVLDSKNVWYNQDYQTLDGVPYIGQKEEDIYISTGFNKWGITNSILSSIMIKDLIINNKSEYEKLFSLKRGISIFKYIGYVFFNVYAFTKSKILYHRNPNCSHIGCSLRKNNISGTWDCPCHGSRFDKNGNPLIGPAKKNINMKEH